MHPTRRQLVGGAAGLAVGSAGCIDGIGGSSGDDREDAAYTAFFTLEQFTDAVAGDGLDVENPIPVGELGHHYEVSTQAQLEVARSRAFVYVNLPGFQRWAVDTAENLEENHPEVSLVDAAEGVELRDANGDAAHDEDGRDEEDGDGHGDFDPHFWLDPVRAADCVETIRDGLAEADPDRADAYESNAERYLEDLSALDERYSAQLEDRELDTVVVASHDSYGYLADRYGFEVHSPVGISPNAEPGSSEIRDTIDFVDENDVDVVLYDAFESENLAKTVVADSGAEKTMPLTSIAGTTEKWHGNNWGYVEQMIEVNLPALKAALKVR